MIVIPVRVPLTQTPLFNPWQDWALGILHMKITCALALMGPNWWLKVSNDVLVDLALALSLSISISISRSHSFLGIYRRLSLPSSHISLCLRLSLSVCLSLSLSLLLLPLPVSRPIIIPFPSPCLSGPRPGVTGTDLPRGIVESPSSLASFRSRLPGPRSIGTRHRRALRRRTLASPPAG